LFVGTRLQLLGPPRVISNGVTLELGSDKPVSVLYYLSQRNDWVSRNELAFLYRPDADDQTALSNVRKWIHRAREHAWAGTLETEKHRVRFQIESDVQAFRQAVAQQRWSDALELYHGPFLSGVSLSATPGFEAWLELERADLNQLWRQAGQQHAIDLEQQQDWLSATRVLTELLKADQLDEDVLQVYLRVLDAQGQRKLALEVFETFRQTLNTELDAEPLESTRALVDSIRHSTVLTTPSPASSAAVPRHNLPAPTTRFIGRKRELERLNDILGDPDTRLVTLIGLGGAGKTRLALELAWRQLEHYPDGVWFVPLAGLSSAELMVPGIASALGFEFSGPREPRQQLLDYLREKNLLIVLDNLEHLLEVVPIITDLLEAAPGLKLVATSRVALELSGEWLFDVDGLSYPPRDTAEDLERFDAVKLFLNRAERVSASIVPTRDTLEAIAEICRKVEGLPLALELAATWTRSLNPTQITKQLETNLELLSSQQRDIPERHRSISVVFEHSWARLGALEQETLASLSVFQGGFTLQSAEQVTGAHLALLLSLINHSLVRRSPNGRYQLHELIRQLAAERLALEQTSTCCERLSSYFVAFLREREEGIKGVHQRGILDEIEVEWGNITGIWAWSVRQGRWNNVEAMLSCLNSRFELKSSYREGAQVFGMALDAFKNQFTDPQFQPEVLAKLLTLCAYFRFRVGEANESELLITQAIQVLEQYPKSKFNAFAWLVMGLLRQSMGHYTQASTFFQRSLDLYEQYGNFWATSRIRNNLGTVAWQQADLEGAKRWHRLALESSRKMGDTREMATSLNGLGIALEASGEIGESIRLYQESLKMYSEVGFLRGQASVLNNLGHVHERKGDVKSARTYYQESLKLKKIIGNTALIGSSLTNLADVLFELGETRAAFEANLEAMRITTRARATPMTLRVLWSFARMEARTGQPHAALRLARFIVTFHECEQWVRDEAAENIPAWNEQASTVQPAHAEEVPGLRTLDEAVEWVAQRHRTILTGTPVIE
jgi:predicted ATPase/DNA-binding SARP family transcriptional activator/Tfp pilus assembly protein PilF